MGFSLAFSSYVKLVMVSKITELFIDINCIDVHLELPGESL